jgi:hypothetical protein
MLPFSEIGISWIRREMAKLEDHTFSAKMLLGGTPIKERVPPLLDLMRN